MQDLGRMTVNVITPPAVGSWRSHQSQDQQLALEHHIPDASELVETYGVREGGGRSTRGSRKRARLDEPCGLRSRALEVQMLGDVPPSAEDECEEEANCFGCDYDVFGAAGPVIPHEACEDMRRFLREQIGSMSLLAIAQHLSAMYRDMAQAVNRSRHPGQSSLPATWSPRMVLRHLRNHNADPYIQAYIEVLDLQEIRDKILSECIFKRVKVDDAQQGEGGAPDGEEKTREIADKDQVACLERIIKLRAQIASADPKKSMFYNGEKCIDMSKATQLIGRRNVVSFLETD